MTATDQPPNTGGSGGLQNASHASFFKAHPAALALIEPFRRYTGMDDTLVRQFPSIDAPITIGASWLYQWTIEDAAGQVVDLSGCSARFVIYQETTRGDVSVVLDLHTAPDSGFAISDPTRGIVDLELTPAQTGKLPESDALWYRLTYSTSAGRIYVADTGSISALK
jgi:hypothetical protein